MSTMTQAAPFEALDLAEYMDSAELSERARVARRQICMWMNAGCQGLDKRSHRLPFIKVGKKRCVYRRDWTAFIAALNARPTEGD
jgi:hypothetical protein